MCGIAGVLTRERDPAAAAAVPLMQAALRHRGPDDRGSWIAGQGRAAFAHTRLSIIDLTPAGHQPMSSADGRFTITFNGEIYNYKALRSALEARGARFHTNSDTEVILQAYAHDGAACLPQLRGMFALAIWDESTQTCLLARDRFGIKPLYYHATDERLVFASEIRALLRSGLVPRRLDPAGVYGYLRTGSVPEPSTLIDGVRCLEAAHFATWRAGVWQSTCYWHLEFAETDADGADDIAQTRAALLDAVAHHHVSDTPVGVFLSGGIDSTALVALSHTLGIQDLHTFSITFPGLSEDEGGLARRSAAHFQTRHAEWAIDAATGRDLFARFLEHGDQPSIDGMNTLAVSHLARERGMKVVLSGLGGDELFGGYPSFTDVPKLARWNRAAAMAGPLRTAAGKVIERVSSDGRRRRAGDLLQQAPTLESAYSTYRGIFTRDEARTLLKRYHLHDEVVQPATDASESDPTPEDRVSRLEITRYMRNQLLRDSDTMSMAHGLELRVPFLDGPLVERVTRIPAARRLQPGKRLLQQAVPELPAWTIAEPKRGFMFPIERWLDGEWKEVFTQVERTVTVPVNTWYRRWCVAVLDRWVAQLEREQA